MDLTLERPEDRKAVMMKCGCAAQGTDGHGNPVCVVHSGLKEGWNIVDENPPDLANREARCFYYGKKNSGRQYGPIYPKKRTGDCGHHAICTCSASSSPSLPFFEYLPDKPYDKYYCGCWGWD